MTRTQKQILPALHNSGKVSDPDLTYIGDRNYTATILKYANLALAFPQLKTDAKNVIPAINECRVVANPPIGGAVLQAENGEELQAESGEVLELDGYDTGSDAGGEVTDILHAIKIKDVIYAVNGGGGDTGDYLYLINKPQINGITLSGDISTSDLGISYDELNNVPQINGHILTGDQSTTDIGIWVDITGTLTTGETTITLQDSSITTSSTVEPYTTVFGLSPTNMVVSSGSVTLTFEAQAIDVGVKVRVS